MTAEAVHDRLVEKWHTRDCGCEDPECAVRVSARERAELIHNTIGTALRKAGWF